MTIGTLTRATGPMTGADLLAGFPASEQDNRAFTAAQVLAYVQQSMTVPATLALAPQYAAPSATGFNVAVTSATGQPSTWLILTPVAGYAAGTITLPANPVAGQRFVCNSTQSVTTLTVAGNGKTVTGAPTTIAANGFFELIFDAVLNAWFRVA